MTWPAVVALLLVALHAAGAGACPELPVAPDGPNEVELQLGATNVNAALGSGALTAAFSRCGELTVFKWPGPSYYNQLDYLTSNAPDARLEPHLGALEDQGAFAGLAYRTARGRGFTWLRDDAWSHTQRYSTDTSDVLVDEAANGALGLQVTATHFVLPDQNVLVDHYEVVRSRRSPVRQATIVFYANFAPTLARLPLFPVADWALDFQNDFAVAYKEIERALLHFLPVSAKAFPHDFSVVNGLLQAPPRGRRALRRATAQLVGVLTEPGVYIASGLQPRDDGFQAGFDDAPMCEHQTAFAERILGAFELPPALLELARGLFVCNTVVTDPGGQLAACRAANGWTYTAENAYTDAQDGRLSRSPLAACQANTALARRLRFRHGRATATAYVAVGSTRDEAYGLLRAARAGDPAAQRATTEQWWDDYLAPAHLPDTADPLITAFARRSLVVMRTATDNASGAIVASVDTQGPYGEDWVRDGSFINYALDLAGYHEVVSRHNRFYARVQRKMPASWSPLYPFDACNPAAPVYPDCIPAGTFETNYLADPDTVTPGNPISFEIDEAGLGVWTMWEHARYLTDPAARAAYLADVCPAIRLGAVNLAACRDASNGLQCFANEDDNIPRTQGLRYDAEALLARAQLLRARGDALTNTQEQVRFFIRELTTPGTLHLSEFYARVQRDLNGDGIAPDYLPENDVPHVWEHAYLYTAAMVAFGSR